MTDFEWTKERVAELKMLYEAGESGSQIASKLGCGSRNAVIGKVHRLGLTGRRVPRTSSPRPQKPRQPKPPALPRRTVRRMRNFGHHFAPLEIKVAEAVTELPPDQSFAPQALLDLKPHHCRWPIAGDGASMLFCADGKREGFSYCPRHCRMAYGTARTMNRAEYETYMRANVRSRKATAA